jgi:cell division protein FtsZ
MSGNSEPAATARHQPPASGYDDDADMSADDDRIEIPAFLRRQAN